MRKVTSLSLPFAVGLSVSAFAADRYVSTDGTYGSDVPGAARYTELQTAINEAVAGETVWVKDGFVCKTGSTALASGNRGEARIAISKPITLRSESGDWRNGATICGAHDTSDASTSGRGARAIRCLYLNAAVTVVGFRLVDGATKATAGGDAAIGGCVWGYGDPTMRNCLISNCVANIAGGAYRVHLEGCRIVDCKATGVWNSYGGGAEGATATNCVFAGNTAAVSGGGTYNVRLLDCVVTNNVSNGGGGGGISWMAATNCVIGGNAALGTFPARGGGGYGGTYANCTIVGNRAADGGGLAGDSSLNPLGDVVGCLIAGNEAPTTAGGGGVLGTAVTRLFFCVVSNNVAVGGVSSAGAVQACVIVDNKAPGFSGGGLYKCAAVTNCTVAGNSARFGGGAHNCPMMVGCVLTNNAATYRGNGFYGCTLYNCRIVGNRKGIGFVGGGGGWDGNCYNCLIADNEGNGFQCWDSASELVNCTFTGNTSGGFTTSAADKLRAVNVISWANGGVKDIATRVSSNCCLSAGSTVPADSVNVFMEDPRLTPDALGNLLPGNRNCRNVSASALPWMTDSADVRSRDLAGGSRIMGPAPELGCFEARAFGLVISIR